MMALVIQPRISTNSFKFSSIRLYRNVSKPKSKEFSELIIKGKNSEFKRREYTKFRLLGYTSPRNQYLPTNVDWPSVWPAATSFKSSVVPLPIRQGFIRNRTENGGLLPKAYGNLELMKIPNFLHLTPKHIKNHCDVLKKFCTIWPSGLTDEATIKDHYPIEVVTHDYVFSGNSIREPQARVVKLSLPLSELQLDNHARHKFLRLISFNSQCQYDAQSNVVTFTVDRCPLRRQNYEYIMYVLTVLYGESNKIEDWEFELEESDWDSFHWDESNSKATLLELLKLSREKNLSPPTFMRDLPEGASTEEDLESAEPIKNYREATTRLFEEGESSQTLEDYKNAVKRLYGLPVNA